MTLTSTLKDVGQYEFEIIVHKIIVAILWEITLLNNNEQVSLNNENSIYTQLHRHA